MIISDLMRREYTAEGLYLRVKPYKEMKEIKEEYSLCRRYLLKNNQMKVLSESEHDLALKRKNLNITFKVVNNRSEYLTDKEKLDYGLEIKKPYEVDRGLYMKSVCEILNFDYETVEEKHPSVINRNEEYFWSSYGTIYLEAYKAFYPLYENIFKSSIISILRNNYIIMPSEQDEDTGVITPGEEIDLDQVRQGIVDKLQGYSSTTEFLQHNPNEDVYLLAKDLSIYTIYYTNLIDVFGLHFLEQVPNLDQGYKGKDSPHQTLLNYNFKIDGEIEKMVLANLNSSDLYIINLGEHELLSNEDQVLIKVENYIDQMENTIKNEVKILESNYLSEDIIEGFINNVLVEDSQLYGSNNTTSTLLLKLAFTTLKGNNKLGTGKGHNKVAVEYFNTARELINNKEYALRVGKVTTVKFVIMKALYEWWENYSTASYASLSIQQTLTRISSIEQELYALGGVKIDYYMMTPSRMKLVIYNQYGRGDEGVERMNKVQRLLLDKFGRNLSQDKESNTSNSINVSNNLMGTYSLRVHI